MSDFYPYSTKVEHSNKSNVVAISVLSVILTVMLIIIGLYAGGVIAPKEDNKKKEKYYTVTLKASSDDNAVSVGEGYVLRIYWVAWAYPSGLSIKFEKEEPKFGPCINVDEDCTEPKESIEALFKVSSNGTMSGYYNGAWHKIILFHENDQYDRLSQDAPDFDVELTTNENGTFSRSLTVTGNTDGYHLCPKTETQGEILVQFVEV
jgi:hypothetical protein